MTKMTKRGSKRIIHSYQLTDATLGEAPYAYDNIGNRVTAQEVNSGATSDIAYVTNDLNQYTQIDTNGNDFTPEYDADGNQTLIQTETGIWSVAYNVQNRAVRFENESDGTVITCDYDYLGRRVFKKVEKDGVVTVHERYLYRDYLQIASLDMMEGQLKNLRKYGDSLLFFKHSLEALESEYKAAIREAKRMCTTSKGETYKFVVRVDATDGDGRKVLAKILKENPQIKTYLTIQCPSDCLSRGGTLK